jgi:hypothetical protein
MLETLNRKGAKTQGHLKNQSIKILVNLSFAPLRLRGSNIGSVTKI